MQAFERYAHWFQECLTCSQCRGCSIVRNGNIERELATDPETGLAVLPQAGFAETAWFDRTTEKSYRVLVLGMNPKGGTRIYRNGDTPESGDVLLYGRYYPDIIKARDPSPALHQILPALSPS